MFTENLLFYKEESLIMAFIDTIKERAKADKKTIVLPESMDKRTYEAAEKILKEGIANLVILVLLKRSRSMVRAMTFLAPQS